VRPNREHPDQDRVQRAAVAQPGDRPVLALVEREHRSRERRHRRRDEPPVQEAHRDDDQDPHTQRVGVVRDEIFAEEGTIEMEQRARQRAQKRDAKVQRRPPCDRPEPAQRANVLGGPVAEVEQVEAPTRRREGSVHGRDGEVVV
jgi:hypothetical protein